jgi:hypothetical protein
MFSIRGAKINDSIGKKRNVKKHFFISFLFLFISKKSLRTIKQMVEKQL